MNHVVGTEPAPTAPILTLDHFQPPLSRLNEEGLTNKQLLDWLLEEEGIQYTLRTLERRLQQWKVRGLSAPWPSGGRGRRWKPWS